MSKTIGAYYQVYKNKKATDFVLSNFKKNFPTSKVMLISDGGDDFTDLAEKYNCKYERLHNIFGNEENKFPQLPYNSERMLEAWRRHKLACDHCEADYTLILEDDVYVKDRFEITTDFHMRGARIGNDFSSEMIDYVKNHSGAVSRMYGMCGGSIYNAHTFKSIYNDVVLDIKRNHDEYIDKSAGWFVLGAIDANITYHFNLRGYSYEISPWLVEQREHVDKQRYPIIHQYKELYK